MVGMKNPDMVLNPDVVAPDFGHDIPFDPTYGYALSELLTLTAPGEADGFESFWTGLYRKAMAVQVDARRVGEAVVSANRRVSHISQ